MSDDHPGAAATLVLLDSMQISTTLPKKSEPLKPVELLLLLLVIASVGLDILTNITAYLGVSSSVVAILKGLILVAVVGSYRLAFSFIIVLALSAISATRAIFIAIDSINVFPKDDAVFFFRILFFVAWLLLFYEKRDRLTFLRWVAYLSVATITLSVFCQFAGLILHIDFFKAYGDQRGGYKGLFYAENDTSVFYLPALIYAMHLWRNGRRLYFFIVLAGLIILGLGSKAALLGAMVVPVAYYYFSHKFPVPISFARRTVHPASLMFWSFGIAGAAIVSGVVYFYLADMLVALNYAQLMRVYAESGLLSSAISFRDLKVLAYFHNLNSLPDLLFGLQADIVTQGFGSDTPGLFMYEIDLFDYLARVGVLGLMLTIFVIWRTAALGSWKMQTPELKTMVFTIFIVGMTVGHTLISSMNGVWIGFWLIAFGGPLIKASANARALSRSTPCKINGVQPKAQSHLHAPKPDTFAQ